MSDIGFTGTREGLSAEQTRYVRALLSLYDENDYVHHGLCVGADEQFHNIAHARRINIIGHPPTEIRFLAGIDEDEFYELMPPRVYLTRNKNIVSQSDMLIACPKEYEEVKRSGTWATIRYARKKGIPIHIIFPDGTREYEE